MKPIDKKPTFIFCGSSTWSTAILKSLIDNNLQPQKIITKVDKPSGRNKKIILNPLARFAEENNISYQQVKNKVEFLSAIKFSQLDFVVVVDFGIIITQEALNIPRFGFINVHPSLLPKYRGTSPVQSAILNNDEKTGVSIMKLDAEIDHGPIFWQQSVNIDKNDTTGSLLEKLLPVGSQGLIEVIRNIDSLAPTEQDHSQAIYTKKILPCDCELNLNLPAQQLVQTIKASQPKPCAWLNYKGKRLKIILAHASPTKEEKQLCLQCTNGSFLVIDKLQPEGKKEMLGKDFLNGLR